MHRRQAWEICIVNSLKSAAIIPGKKFKNNGNQIIILADKANFSFDLRLILVILRRFFATLHRF